MEGDLAVSEGTAQEVLLGGPTMNDQQLPEDSIALSSILSLDASKRNPVHFLTPQTIVTFCGSTVVILDTATSEQQYLWGKDQGGIGAVAVHPSRELFAVAEKCSTRAPNVYLYSYPELELMKTLEKGTEKAYSSAAFDLQGEMLATVGSFPDYMLTLWNWKDKTSILRCKAFSQEVYNVKFSPYHDGHLITSGTGHIRLWRMANTFTGLKLQGALGKFGKVELSDVCAFCELEDGKLLSGSEFGQLLLWDGDLIKAVLMREGQKPCHSGNVNVVEHDSSKGHIITGGVDGVVCIWDYATIKDAEPEDDSMVAEISPMDEVSIGDNCRIKSLIWDRQQWIIFAESGAIYRLSLPEFGAVSKGSPAKTLLEFNSSAIVGLDCVDGEDCAITAGGDGSVRLYNYIEKRLVFSTLFSSAASHLMALPKSLDAEKRTILVGFKDGTVRALSRCSDGWKLLSAIKPHKVSVVTMDIGSTTERLATGSKDGRVFFFRIENRHTYKPIAYTTVAGTITTIMFTRSEEHVLIGCTDGQILKVQVPQIEENQQSFERALSIESLTFKLPEVLHESNDSTKPETSDVENSDGNVKDDGNVKESGENSNEEDPIEECIPSQHQESPICLLKQDKGQSFNVTFGGVLAGKVYQCCLRTMSVLAIIPGPPSCISVLQYSQSGNFLLMGSDTGIVQVTQCNTMGSPSTMHSWQRSVHDGQNGRVTGIVMSADDQYLLSVAEDMTFYIQKMMIGDGCPVTKGKQDQAIPSKSEDAAPKVKDIVDGNAYTIEEAKQKEEQDVILTMAEAKKRRVKDFINNLRGQFEEIISENDSRPDGQKIPKECLEVDSDLRDIIEQQTLDREDIARKEMQWEQEKTRLSVKKLQDKYFQNTVVQYAKLRCFESQSFVTSFQTQKLQEGVDELMEHLEAKIEQERMSYKDRETSMGLGISERKDAEHGGSGCHKGSVGFKAISMADDVSGKLSKTEIRRIARKKREEAWEAYNAMQPNESEDNPQDVAEIQKAEMNLGDFKLKSEPTYIAPEEKRMTPDKKRVQMLKLDKGLFEMKMCFNQKFFSLRERKKGICSTIQRMNKRLMEINTKLGIQENRDNPTMLLEEIPESREIVTAEDIERHGNEQNSGSKKASGVLGDTQSDKHSRLAENQGKGNEVIPQRNWHAQEQKLFSSILAHIPHSSLEKEEAQFSNCVLEQERNDILNQITLLKNDFDTALLSLRHEKLRTEADVKYGEISWLVMFNELELLNDFQKREIGLNSKLQDKVADKGTILSKISQCQERLEQKKAELDSLVERQTAVIREFNELVPENYEFHDPLAKIFYRKIKRSNKRSGDDEDEGSGSDEDMDNEDFDDDDEEEDDEEEEVCPLGCDQDVYSKVCDLREKRLDEEELLNEFQKSIEQINKDKEQAAKKLKLVEQSLSAINSDMVEFQKEKQGELNKLDSVVMLKMYQMECLIEEQAPKDLTKTILFCKKEMHRLKKRILELDEERLELKTEQRELKKDFVQLTKSKKLKEGTIADLETRMYNVQLLKFGQTIDLDLLDKVNLHQGCEEIKKQALLQEQKFAKELEEWDQKIKVRTEELAAVTSVNTTCLNKISELTRFQMGLEKTLASSQTRMLVDSQLHRRKETMERDLLVRRVNEQASRLDSLKKQIVAIKRKDTSVYD